jgi:hypothetical protein
MIYLSIVFLFAAKLFTMGKAQRRKKNRDERSRKVEKPAQKENKRFSGPEESDEKMDFGGLPARDLKKNLGCG